MVEKPNFAGKIHLANVSIPEALAFDPETDDKNRPDTWQTLKADDYDADIHGHMEFYCPCCFEKDDESLVRLKRPSKETIQPIPFEVEDPKTGEVITDERTGEPMLFYKRWRIPPRYTTASNETHVCDLANRQNELAQTARDYDATVVDSQSGAYIFNLNIPAGQKAMSRRRPRVTTADLGDFDMATLGTPGKVKIHRSGRKPSRKLSEGIQSVGNIADLLDKTEFENRGDRENMLFRNGPQEFTLAEAYQGDAKDLYRALFAKEKGIAGQPSANHDHIAVFRFKPNNNKSFWKRQPDRSTTVPSNPERVTGPDGVTFYVTTHLNFQTDTAYQAFLADHRSTAPKDRSFLVFTENATVDLKHHDDEVKAAKEGDAQHATVHVHATVFDRAQMMKWSPREAQLEIDFPSQPETEASSEDDLTPV